MWGGALVVLAALAYWPSLANGFIWDDDMYVVENLALRDAEGLAAIWFRLGATPQYYPLVHTTFWIEYQLWGAWAPGYHAVNLLVHITAAVLVWRLLVVLGVPGAWFAAAIFAVHPVGVESVAWITERKNVLSCALALGAMLAYLRFAPAERLPAERLPAAGAAAEKAARAARPTGARGRACGFYGLALVLYVAAVLSKTVTASVPAVLLVVYWWKRGRITLADVRPLAPLLAIGFSLAMITVWMERSVVGAVGSDWALSPLDRVLVAGRALWFYAGKLAWPHPLIFFYERWEIDSRAPWQYAYPAAAVAVIVGLWLARGRIGRGPLAAVLIFAGELFPALGFVNVFPFRFSFVADHFQYHASIALIALAAAVAAAATAATRALERPSRRVAWLVPVAAGLVLLVLAAVTNRRTLVYESVVTLWQDTIAGNPQCWAAYNNLGHYWRNRGQHQQAIELFRAGLAVAPQRALMRRNLGQSLAAVGQIEEAEAHLRASLEGDLNDHERATAHVALGNIAYGADRLDEAIAQQRAALELNPANAQAHYALGLALAAQGNLEAGIDAILAALALVDSAVGYNELGTLLTRAGRLDEAASAYVAAVRLQGDEPKYREDLARALMRLGLFAQAEPHLQAALGAQPPRAETHVLAGIACRARGAQQAAAEHFARALAIDPDHREAAAQLAELRSEVGSGPASRDDR